MKSEKRILTINSGSSSIKFALFQEGKDLIQSGKIDRIGLSEGLFHVVDRSGNAVSRREEDFPDHDAAIREMLRWFRESPALGRPDAVGHRVVHGGSRFYTPQRITPDLIKSLWRIIPLAPDHLPHEIKAIEAVGRFQPGVPQVACFDTAFHRDLPAEARTYALPRELRQRLRRYGFHGLSYEYIFEEFRKEAGHEAAKGKLIIAHLGNGASMVAVRNGKSMDTSMGFTPAGGLVMSTRCGDLDPGVMLYLMDELDIAGQALNDLINKRSGLLGLSGISPDMKDLMGREKDSPDAAEAVALFCYQARKFLGAYAAVLGGLDTLIFTGGIGENAPEIRDRICRGLEFLGIEIDGERNGANAPVISASQSPAAVRVMKTDEEMMIARHTSRLLENEGLTG